MGELAIMLLAWFFVWLGTRDKSSSRRSTHSSRVPKEPPVVTLDRKLDNRGYAPYDGEVSFTNGLYFTHIWGSKDFPLMRTLHADSIDKLQDLVDPLLEERKAAAAKRKARRKNKKPEPAA